MSLRKRAFVTEIEYPETDGQPMGETDVHRALIMSLINQLESFFRNEPEVYVSGDLLLYYEAGNPRKFVVPDVFVARGVGKHQRRIYKLWEEGRAPDVVFEISSGSTWAEDLQRKWRLYAELGVTEYFIFDPEYDYLKQPLLAYRLEDGQYLKLEVSDGRVRSEVLGLDVVDTGETLRLFNPQTGQFLRTPAETEAALRAEIKAREQEAEARQREAEAREQEAKARQQETEARLRAEAELARLREELARLRPQS